MAKISTRGTAVRDAIANRRDFDTHGSFWGREVSDLASLPTGELARTDAWNDFRSSGAAFVVYSYRTPIAWWSEAHGWTVPPVKYSVTTSRHQSQVRYALAGI